MENNMQQLKESITKNNFKELLSVASTKKWFRPAAIVSPRTWLDVWLKKRFIRT